MQSSFAAYNRSALNDISLWHSSLFEANLFSLKTRRRALSFWRVWESFFVCFLFQSVQSQIVTDLWTAKKLPGRFRRCFATCPVPFSMCSSKKPVSGCASGPWSKPKRCYSGEGFESTFLCSSYTRGRCVILKVAISPINWSLLQALVMWKFAHRLRFCPC